MRRQMLLLIAGLLFITPGQVTAQESADEAAVRNVVEYYFDGVKNQNADSMKKAFHQQALLFVPGPDDSLNETRQLRPDLFSDTRPFPVVARMISMWVSDQAASVRVEFRYPTAYSGDKADFRKPPPGFEQTEYLSLIKFKHGWRIVSRAISVMKSNTAKSYLSDDGAIGHRRSAEKH